MSPTGLATASRSQEANGKLGESWQGVQGGSSSSGADQLVSAWGSDQKYRPDQAGASRGAANDPEKKSALSTPGKPATFESTRNPEFGKQKPADALLGVESWKADARRELAGGNGQAQAPGQARKGGSGGDRKASAEAGRNGQASKGRSAVAPGQRKQSSGGDQGKAAVKKGGSGGDRTAGGKPPAEAARQGGEPVSAGKAQHAERPVKKGGSGGDRTAGGKPPAEAAPQGGEPISAGKAQASGPKDKAGGPGRVDDGPGQAKKGSGGDRAARQGNDPGKTEAGKGSEAARPGGEPVSVGRAPEASRQANESFAKGPAGGPSNEPGPAKKGSGGDQGKGMPPGLAKKAGGSGGDRGKGTPPGLAKKAGGSGGDRGKGTPPGLAKKAGGSGGDKAARPAETARQNDPGKTDAGKATEAARPGSEPGKPPEAVKQGEPATKAPTDGPGRSDDSPKKGSGGDQVKGMPPGLAKKAGGSGGDKGMPPGLARKAGGSGGDKGMPPGLAKKAGGSGGDKGMPPGLARKAGGSGGDKGTQQGLARQAGGSGGDRAPRPAETARQSGEPGKTEASRQGSEVPRPGGEPGKATDPPRQGNERAPVEPLKGSEGPGRSSEAPGQLKKGSGGQGTGLPPGQARKMSSDGEPARAPAEVARQGILDKASGTRQGNEPTSKAPESARTGGEQSKAPDANRPGEPARAPETARPGAESSKASDSSGLSGEKRQTPTDSRGAQTGPEGVEHRREYSRPADSASEPARSQATPSESARGERGSDQSRVPPPDPTRTDRSSDHAGIAARSTPEMSQRQGRPGEPGREPVGREAPRHEQVHEPARTESAPGSREAARHEQVREPARTESAPGSREAARLEKTREPGRAESASGTREAARAEQVLSRTGSAVGSREPGALQAPGVRGWEAAVRRQIEGGTTERQGPADQALRQPGVPRAGVRPVEVPGPGEPFSARPHGYTPGNKTRHEELTRLQDLESRLRGEVPPRPRLQGPVRTDFPLQASRRELIRPAEPAPGPREDAQRPATTRGVQPPPPGDFRLHTPDKQRIEPRGPDRSTSTGEREVGELQNLHRQRRTTTPPVESIVTAIDPNRSSRRDDLEERAERFLPERERPVAAARDKSLPVPKSDDPQRPDRVNQSAPGQGGDDTGGSGGGGDSDGSDRREQARTASEKHQKAEAQVSAAGKENESQAPSSPARRIAVSRESFQLSLRKLDLMAATRTTDAIVSRHVSHSMTSVLRRVYRQQEIESMDVETAVNSLGVLLRLGGEFTFDHSSRVLEFAVDLADQVGVTDRRTLSQVRYGALLKDIGDVGLRFSYQSEETLDQVGGFLAGQDVRRAGLLHDIGKTRIPASILHKPDKLSEHEFQIMKMHPIYGEEMVHPIPSLRHLCPAIRGHHERWDGRGYPDGLQAEQIPLAARIIAVADVFDALSAPRPYKPGMQVEQVWQILRDGRGNHFDPLLVDAFRQVLRRRYPHSHLPA